MGFFLFFGFDIMEYEHYHPCFKKIEHLSSIVQGIRKIVCPSLIELPVHTVY